MSTGVILLGGEGGACDGLASRPGGSSNTPRHASCYGNRVKLRPCGPLARVRLYLFYIIVLEIGSEEPGLYGHQGDMP